MKLKIETIAYHRNGVGGEPFYVVLFTDCHMPKNHFMATVFSQENHVAVIDVKLAASGVIEFGQNSWRGDQYEPALRKAIQRHERLQECESVFYPTTIAHGEDAATKIREEKTAFELPANDTPLTVAS